MNDIIITIFHIVVTEQSAYFCKVFYEKIASLEWIVKLIIVRRLKALEEV